MLARGLLVTLIYLQGTSIAVADRDHEQYMAERVLENLQHGQPIWLSDNRHDFLALYQPVFGVRPKQAVLLVHGMGGHPDWPEVIQPLRTRLPGRGWSTLSLQMPVLAPSESFDEYGATIPETIRRIAAGIEYLRKRDYASVFIIGYSYGAVGALSYLVEKPDADGLVTIGVLAREFLQPQIDVTALLSRISLPVLDVYGGRDFPEVIRKAQDRRHAARSHGNTDFRQAVVEGADHYFTGQEDTLLRIIVDWLDRYPPRLETPALPGKADNS